MNNNATSKEWRCSSTPYKSLYIFMILIFGFIAVISWFTLKDPILYAKYPSTKASFIGSIGVILFILILSRVNNIYRLKKVKFTPDAVYIKGRPIPIRLIESIEFVKHLKSKHAVMSHLFKLKLKPNRVIEQEIYFAMEFRKSFFYNQENYDYQNDFINVIMSWAYGKKP